MGRLSGMMPPLNGYTKVKGTGGGLSADLFLLYIGESPLRRLSSGRREEIPSAPNFGTGLIRLLPVRRLQMDDQFS
jgi:hypothetical protein